jgi:hypothetical protein
MSTPRRPCGRRACIAVAVAMGVLAPWPGLTGTASGQRLPAPVGAVVPGADSARGIDAAAWRAPQLAIRPATAPATPPTAARAPRRRDRFVAGALSTFIPGLGHVYAGEPWRGLAVFALAEGGLVTALKSDDRVVRLTAGGVGFGTYLYGIMDATAAADRYNRRHVERAIQ